MMREALKLAALHALRGVLLKFVLPVVVVIVLVGGLIGGIVAAIFGGTGTAAAAGDCTISGGPGGKKTAVHASQVEIAKAIDEGIREIGFSGKVSRLTIIAAFGESSLQNINYGDGAINPDGTVATSIGILQQQDSWGTREERMNPKVAAQLFVLGPKRGGGGLADTAGWADMSETEAIHRVQKNADPTHYSSSVAPADAVIKEAGIDVTRSGKNYNDGTEQKGGNGSAQSSSSGGCGTGRAGGDANGGDTYPWISRTPGPGIYHEDSLGFYYGECTSYTAWKLNELAGASGDDPTAWPIGNNKGGNGAHLGNAAEWRDAWIARGWRVSTTPVANSVAWWGAYGGGGIGEAGHVAWVDAVLEDGKVVLSEYNNPTLAPPGHKYSKRAPAISTAQAYLVPPDEFIKKTEPKNEEKNAEESASSDSSEEPQPQPQDAATPPEEAAPRRWSGG